MVIPATAEPCEDCITLGDSVRIGSEQDSVIITAVPRVIVDGHGRTYLTEWEVGTLILVYDREGRFTGTLAARGTGPGEYQNVYALAMGPADSVFVSVDWQRLLVFSPDGKLRREVRTETGSPSFLAVLPDSRVLAVESIHTPERAGLPVHLLDSKGSIVRSFGHASIYPPGPIAQRLIARGENGRIWIGERYNYRFDETDTSGRIFRTLGVALPEDRVYINSAAFDSAIAATPMVKRTKERLARREHLLMRPILNLGSAYVDSAGRLWTVVRTAKQNWRDVRITYRETEADHVALSDDVPALIYDTTIDVIDVKSGRLIARRRLSGYGDLTNDGRLVRVRSAPTGYLEVSITNLHLAR